MSDHLSRRCRTSSSAFTCVKNLAWSPEHACAVWRNSNDRYSSNLQGKDGMCVCACVRFRTALETGESSNPAKCGTYRQDKNKPAGLRETAKSLRAPSCPCYLLKYSQCSAPRALAMFKSRTIPVRYLVLSISSKKLGTPTYVGVRFQGEGISAPSHLGFAYTRQTREARPGCASPQRPNGII